MPIYEFECGQCGAGFERLQKLSDPDPEQCPACQASGTVRRRISAPSFRLAGSGWYETDFKTDRDRKRNLAGNDPSPAAGTDKAAGGGGTSGKPADNGSAAKTPAASAAAASTSSSTGSA